MSIQQHRCPSRLPSRVRFDPFGEETVVGEVLETTLDATAGRGPEDILLVDVDGSRYRVPATDADPVHDYGR